MPTQLKATQRLQAATKVKADRDNEKHLSINATMKKVAAQLDDAELGSGVKLGVVEVLEENYGLDGLLAPLNEKEIFFNASTLKEIARELEKLEAKEDAAFELGFEIIGGKLCMIVADTDPDA
jgi:hypothetical protein